MNRRKKFEKALTYAVFVCYVLLLVKILFVSRLSSAGIFSGYISRRINIIPFSTIMEYIRASGVISQFAFANIAGNIIMFVPLGVYLPFFKKDKRVVVNLLLIFAISLLVEILQWILAIGAADIDDIILNCLGGFIGILGYKLLRLILRAEKNVSVAIAMLSVLGLPVILYYLLMINMRF